MINFFYSGYNDTNLISTIGFGCGVSSLKFSNLKELSLPINDIKQNNIFSYQGSFAVGYILSQKITFFIKYTYFSTVKKKDFDAFDENLLTLSFRYNFS
jgi:hypothetical protein